MEHDIDKVYETTLALMALVALERKKGYGGLAGIPETLRKLKLFSILDIGILCVDRV